jgi:hypothetical protein
LEGQTKRAAARIDRISCVDFPRTRHGLESVIRRGVAAVARDERFNTAAKVMESRWLKGVSAGIVVESIRD